MDTFNPMVNLPMGFGMALAQDLNAMEHFASLSADEQRRIIEVSLEISIPFSKLA